jgi:hypothetical protein
MLINFLVKLSLKTFWHTLVLHSGEKIRTARSRTVTDAGPEGHKGALETFSGVP